MLTLLALVLAIGIVVDDAIVVLENIHRRIKRGGAAPVRPSAGRAGGIAVVATTVVLVAVFVPITFLDGKAGNMFTEFAVTMSAAVCFSSLVALTLTPLLCSRSLKTHEEVSLGRQVRSSNWGDAPSGNGAIAPSWAASPRSRS